MEATDLRIGNLIDFEATTHIVQSIDRGGLMTSYWIKDTKFEDLYLHPIIETKPIPLTEEWLVKCPKDNDVFWSNFSNDSGGYFLWVSGFKVYIKYLHQLQNIYHSLTGGELIINI